MQYASELYPGIFYPYLIYLCSLITSLSLESAAHLLNSIFITIMCYGFIEIVRTLGGKDKQLIIIAALVILLFPSLLKYRAFIIRDFVFLACFIWSIYFLLKYKIDKLDRFLISWALILIIASFARIESAIYLALISTFLFPWSLLLKNPPLSISLALPISLVLGVFLFNPSIINPVYIESLHPSLSYPFEYIGKKLSQLSKIFNKNSDGNIFMTLFNALSQALYDTIRRLEIVYAILALVTIKKGLTSNNSEIKNVFIYYISTSLAILTLFTVSAGYSTSRYTMALTLTVLLLAPFTLSNFYTGFKEKTRNKQIALTAFALILCILSFKRLTFDEQHLELSAGLWALNNLPKETVLASNNSKILYYAQQEFRYIPIKNRHYRYNTNYLISERNEIQFNKSNYLAFKVATKSVDDINQEKLYNSQFGEPIKKIKQSKSSYVNFYKLK